MLQLQCFVHWTLQRRHGRYDMDVVRLLDSLSPHQHLHVRPPSPLDVEGATADYRDARAEMGSMAPTVGGQYHWVSEFAPRDYQKFISYLMGWLCVLAWQVGCTSGAYLVGTQIQGLIVLNNPDYVFEQWHGTCLTIAVFAAAILFNTVSSCLDGGIPVGTAKGAAHPGHGF